MYLLCSPKYVDMPGIKPYCFGSSGPSKSVPGWMEFVHEARSKSLFWHNIWIDCGRPRTGVIADIMRRTRAAYHYAIRFVRKMKNKLLSSALLTQF